jgi:hypothetical protein
MFVLVEETAESISSADVEMVEPASVGDRVGRWTQWRRAVQGAVRPVAVEEGIELTQHVHEMGLVPDQRAGPRARAGRSGSTVP